LLTDANINIYENLVCDILCDNFTIGQIIAVVHSKMQPLR